MVTLDLGPGFRLDLVLTAAWTIIDSKAMPVLLEGVLLLGPSFLAKYALAVGIARPVTMLTRQQFRCDLLSIFTTLHRFISGTKSCNLVPLPIGNSVNAASKNLGGAVGVTLESLTKLGHTQCLPAKQAAHATVGAVGFGFFRNKHHGPLCLIIHGHSCFPSTTSQRCSPRLSNHGNRTAGVLRLVFGISEYL